MGTQGVRTYEKGHSLGGLLGSSAPVHEIFILLLAALVDRVKKIFYEPERSFMRLTDSW